MSAQRDDVSKATTGAGALVHSTAALRGPGRAALPRSCKPREFSRKPSECMLLVTFVTIPFRRDLTQWRVRRLPSFAVPACESHLLWKY